MKGNNEIELNLATMSEALEEYLNKRLVGVVLKVSDIKANSGTYSPTFTISVQTVEPAP